VRNNMSTSLAHKNKHRVQIRHAFVNAGKRGIRNGYSVYLLLVTKAIYVEEVVQAHLQLGSARTINIYIFTPHMPVYLVVSLPDLLYIYI